MYKVVLPFPNSYCIKIFIVLYKTNNIIGIVTDMVKNYLISEMYAHTLSIVIVMVTMVTPAHRTRTQNDAGRLCGTLLVLAIVWKYKRG